LLRGNPSTETVGGVARRWGWSRQRFITAYRAEYGETPSQTLHR
jgi:hypothetical protein